MNMVLFYKMTFSYMILFKHKFLKIFYPIFIMRGEHQAKLSWWIELIICQHSNILCSRFYLNQITHNCKFLFTIFLGRTFVPFLPTYQPKHQRTLLCNKKCIQELADASSRTPLHPAAAMIEHQTHVQLTSLTNTYADKDHLYTFLNMLGLDLIGQEIIHKNLFKFKTHKKKITKTNAISNSKHIFCLMQPKQLQTKS